MRFPAFLLTAVLLIPAPALAEEGEGGGLLGPKVEYITLEPEIVTNYGSGGRMRFLRAKATVRATGSDAAEAARYHMAYLQNTLLLLLGGQSNEEAATLESREKIRAQALEQINAFLEAEGEPKIDDLLFTEYLVQ